MILDGLTQIVLGFGLFTLIIMGVFVFAYFMARLLGVFTDWMDEILDGDRDKFGR
jgi:hypothetical protein